MALAEASAGDLDPVPVVPVVAAVVEVAHLVIYDKADRHTSRTTRQEACHQS